MQIYLQRVFKVSSLSTYPCLECHGDTPRRKCPSLNLVGRLWSGPPIVGRIGSGVCFSASFQIFPRRGFSLEGG